MILEGDDYLYWTSEMVKRFWDFESQRCEGYFTNGNGEALIKIFNREIKKAQKILDFGCGKGYFLSHLIKTCKSELEAKSRFFGTDVSKESVAAANLRIGWTAAYSYDDKIIQDQTGKFDLVFCFEVIEHVYDDALKNILQGVSNCLRPGGVAIFSTPNEENLEQNMFICPESGKKFHRWQHVRNWTYLELRKTLLTAGFLDINGITTNVGFYDKSLLKAFYRRLKYYTNPNPNLLIVCKKP
jgi:2-polyprenyl-3-methyl-5-hydroxy-6-metoxy-1,4-benzoquinol methylase